MAEKVATNEILNSKIEPLASYMIVFTMNYIEPGFENNCMVVSFDINIRVY